MNKIAICLLVSCAAAAMTVHAKDVAVIKDTRQYVPYTESITGPVGCTMPKDVEHPNLDDQNECRVTRSKLTASGELLTRNNALGVCTRTVYSGGAWRLGGDPSGGVIPDQSVREETFKCMPSGARAG
ncbi:MAG: hypothetical protein EKK53_27880 [Burkholderiales bacterium]|nr:MAG: hypothetical protein EKK53_27880 [Burkholderiales bacterium]